MGWPVSNSSGKCAAANVAVALGGRWAVLEEERNAFAEALMASHESQTSLSEALLEAERGCSAAKHAADSARFEAAGHALEVSELEVSLRSTQRFEAAAAEQNEEWKAHSAALKSESERLAEEQASLSTELAASHSELRELRSALTRVDVERGHEKAGRLAAESRIEGLRAELGSSEARLANRGTHVELLLREKERLWS